MFEFIFMGLYAMKFLYWMNKAAFEENEVHFLIYYVNKLSFYTKNKIGLIN